LPRSGRIEKLAVSFTGEYIQKGQVLATVYSPELITAQQELLEASRSKQSFPQIYEASKERLRQLKISQTLIAGVENSGTVLSAVDIVSGTSGIVISRNVSTGDYVGQGTVLFQVADLSRLWVMFDAYESDLPFLRRGDRINFTVQAFPGRTFTGAISYIDPVINPGYKG
jgi:Cu(I)/Ag(I) efflux system membrane fusion protein